jgi:hypothetical protein
MPGWSILKKLKKITGIENSAERKEREAEEKEEHLAPYLKGTISRDQLKDALRHKDDSKPKHKTQSRRGGKSKKRNRRTRRR